MKKLIRRLEHHLILVPLAAVILVVVQTALAIRTQATKPA